MSSEYQHSLFGCFENCYVCCCAIWCPCIVAGRIAEKIGDSCCCCGLIACVPIANFICRACQRQKVREQKGISGSIICDCLAAWCCYACTLCQDGMEVGAMSMAAERQPTVDQAVERE
jgi:Cys-rich protein (TIGR01571 family)